ncbi:MerR family transcriptional regulator [Paenarthrobacter nitroguajacolicus]
MRVKHHRWKDCGLLIGELSERTGVSRRALRYYEEQGLLVPDRACNGYRVYAQDAPLIVSQIQGLFTAGLDSDAIRRYLPCARGSAPHLEMCAELRSHLTGRAAELKAQAETLTRQREKMLAHLT